MTYHPLIQIAIGFIGLGLTIFMVYVLARVASWAWFKSLLQYNKLKGGNEDNAKEK